MSTPCIGLELEQLSNPTVLPWKPPLKDKMLSSGDPGAWCVMVVSSSSFVNSTLPPLTFSMYFMNISLMAFSLEQVPHIIGNIWSIPFGAILMKVSRKISAWFLLGYHPTKKIDDMSRYWMIILFYTITRLIDNINFLVPFADRFARAEWFFVSANASRRAGWL